MLVNALYNVVDRIFVGRGVNETALGGLSLVLPLMTISLAFGMLFGVGSSNMISIRLGQGKRDEAENALNHCLFLLVFAGMMFMVLGLTFLDPILSILGAPKGSPVLEYARNYTRIILYGQVFSMVGFGFSHCTRAQGFPTITMLGMLIGAGMNTALDPLFIFVFRWGVEGAAWATIISQLLSAVWLLYFHAGKKMVLHLKPLAFIKNTLSRLGGLRLRREMVFRIMAFGSAQFLLQFVMSGVQVIYNLSMTWYGPAGLGVPNGGEIGLAGMNIVSSMTMLILMPVFGINQGAQPILGYNYGAKKYRRVLNAYLGAVGAATGICLLGFILVQTFAETIVRFFAPQGSPPLLSFTPWAMRIAILAMPLNGFQIVSSNLYVVTGRPKLSIILSMLRQCILLIPFMLLFGFIWGLRGVVFSIPIVDGITFFIVGGMIFFELKKLRRGG